MSIQTNLKYTSANIIHLYPFKFYGTVNIFKKFGKPIKIPCWVLARTDTRYLITATWDGKPHKWWVKQIGVLEYE